jgi:hypothetical protein
MSAMRQLLGSNERAYLLLLRQPIFARKRGFALSVLDIQRPGQG